MPQGDANEITPKIVHGFRLRGRDVSRLEGFSDAVFGFALTLLVVSLDVPRSFQDLEATVAGFPAFAICFLFLALIWHAHHRFCRRFGLDDGMTQFLTCVMLFLVLFYVYPLKFLFNLSITATFFGAETAHAIPITRAQLAKLLVIYGLGLAAVYVAMVLLYLHAYRRREELELTEREKFETRYQIWRFSVLVAFGLVAAALALVPSLTTRSSLIYLLIFPVLRISGMIHNRRREARFAAVK